MAESTIMRRVMLAVSRAGAVIFRQNVGMGWTGSATVIQQPTVVSVRPGDVVIRQARPLHAGLCKGSSDLIGWKSIRITAPMIGRKLAIFAAIETKDIRGRVSPEQQNFVDQVKLAGGIAGIARSPEEAIALLGEVDAA